MYCEKCGDRLDDGQQFCGKCGQRSGERAEEIRNTQYTQYTQMTGREKSEGGAAVLSFLWAGVGQIYVGRIGRGLGIILAYILLMIVGIASIISSQRLEYSYSDYWYDYYNYVYDGPMLMVGLLFILICFVLLIWNVFDAYKLAKTYNASLRSTGNPPW
jgi:TM2 domain-containing membrane protein YozV